MRIQHQQERLWACSTLKRVNSGRYSDFALFSQQRWRDFVVPAIFGQTLYLGVNIWSIELSPRIELTYAPYTFASKTVTCSGALGDIKYSIFNPTQFAAVNGDCWVPMDGVKALAGTAMGAILTSMTNVPNGGGYFLRAQDFTNSNIDPDRTSSTPIATSQDQAYLSHNHPFTGTTSTDGFHSHGIPDATSFRGNGTTGTNGGDGEADLVNSTYGAGSHNHSVSGTTNATGGTETRPKNLNFWVYIRVN